MTEGAAYAACTLALLAFARCLERPTVVAQLLALAALALAAGIRLQLASLGVALLGALVAARAPGARPPAAVRATTSRRLWPLLVLFGGGILALAVRAALGNPLAGYGDLWRSYDLRRGRTLDLAGDCRPWPLPGARPPRRRPAVARRPRPGGTPRRPPRRCVRVALPRA